MFCIYDYTGVAHKRKNSHRKWKLRLVLELICKFAGQQLLNKKREYWISNPVNKLKFKFWIHNQSLLPGLIIVHPVSCLICMYSVLSIYIYMHLSYIYYCLVFTIQYSDMSASGEEKCFVFCLPCVITRKKLPSLVFMYFV